MNANFKIDIEKMRKIFSILTDNEKKELIRYLTNDVLESLVPYNVQHRGAIMHSISQSKRQELLFDLLTFEKMEDAIRKHKKHFRFLNKVVFKIFFDIIKKNSLKHNKVTEKYPELFI